jgi:hypothetical protein
MSQPAIAGDGRDFALFAELFGLLNGSWTTHAISAAVELGAVDLLAGGVGEVRDLASATGCHEPSLRRLLRALVTLDICEERENGSFALTALGSVLESNAPISCRAMTIYGRHKWPLWENLGQSIKTGVCARTRLHGTTGFQHLERDPAAASDFHRAMSEATGLIARAVVPAYDFSRFRRIVDAGGGYGEMLVAILRACPATRGVLFDLADTMGGARQHLEKAGVSDRCELIAGSFFESVPAGADAYLLKSVIHDWDDERGAAILRTCREAMSRDAKLLLVEQIMPDRMEATLLHQDIARRDLNMLVTLGGRERTANEYRYLLDSAGLNLTRIVPAALNFGVIEAVRA